MSSFTQIKTTTTQNQDNQTQKRKNIKLKELKEILKMAEKAPVNPNQSNKIQKIKKLFNVKKPLIGMSVEEYLVRILSNGNIEGSTLCIAAYFFKRVVWNQLGRTEGVYHSIKIFASCLWLAHKLNRDNNYNGESFARLVGFPIKKLKKLEILLIRDLFNYELNFNVESIDNLKKWMDVNITLA